MYWVWIRIQKEGVVRLLQASNGHRSPRSGKPTMSQSSRKSDQRSYPYHPLSGRMPRTVEPFKPGLVCMRGAAGTSPHSRLPSLLNSRLQRETVISSTALTPRSRRALPVFWKHEKARGKCSYRRAPEGFRGSRKSGCTPKFFLLAGSCHRRRWAQVFFGGIFSRAVKWLKTSC